MLNECNFIGHVGRDPSVKESPTGLSYCSLSLAVKKKRKTKDGQWEQVTNWLWLSCFGHNAAFIDKWVRKGDLVLCKCHVETEQSTDINGKAHTKYKFILNDITKLTKTTANADNKPARNEDQPQYESPVAEADDIPF